MKLSGRTLAVLGTAVVAVLAVGTAAAMGVFTGDSVAAPSARASATASESASESASPSESVEPIDAPDDFCELMGQMLDLVNYEGADLTDTTATDDAALLAQLRDQLQVTMDLMSDVAAIEGRAATILDDRSVAAAFVASARTFEYIVTSYDEVMRDATTVDDYFTRIAEIGTDTRGEAILAAGQAASDEITAYVDQTCGIWLGGATAGETAAKVDVSTLGKEIATVFVDWISSEPYPLVTVVNGSYLVQGVAVAQVSEGVELEDQSGTGPTDWCVSVTYSGVPTASYRYSADEGLMEGTCASRAGA
jgi:hypothetical protein